MTMAAFDDTAVARMDDAPQLDMLQRKAVEARDRRDRLLLRFDPDSQTATICFPGAELVLRAVDGVIEVSSTSAIRISSTEGVELVGAAAGAAMASNRLSVSAEGVNLATNALRAHSSQTDFIGGTLTARAERVKMTWEKCERIVGRTFEYARHAYHRFDVLLHVRAGRIRTECKGTHLLQAQTMRIQADEDVRVQGRAINLG